jgi:hypothetical protein
LAFSNSANPNQAVKLLLDGCRIASAVTRFTLSSTGCCTNDEVELVNCFDGTNTLNERYAAAGALTTERSTILSGGATDNVGAFSLKLVSNTNADKFVLPLESFWFDVDNLAIGSAKTATVEVISSTTLNNDDIRLQVEYMGTTGTTRTSFVDSGLATPLTASAALSTSTATWGSPPSTPVKQLLQVTFTPQVAGRVRGRVRLGKTSTTVWVNPQLTLT